MDGSVNAVQIKVTAINKTTPNVTLTATTHKIKPMIERDTGIYMFVYLFFWHRFTVFNDTTYLFCVLGIFSCKVIKNTTKRNKTKQTNFTKNTIVQTKTNRKLANTWF